VCEGELPFDAILSEGVKKVSSGDGDALRREALQRKGSWPQQAGIGSGRTRTATQHWKTFVHNHAQSMFEKAVRRKPLGEWF
jgi:hypothetical protein